MIENAERTPQQAISLRQYFRRLRQAYYKVIGRQLDKDEVEDVNAVRPPALGTSNNLQLTLKYFIDYYAIGKKSSSPRPKPVPSGEDLTEIVYYLYYEDTSIYPDERQRVQQTFLMLIYAYSGLRPSSTTKLRQGRSI
jgi:hypothetical protein